MVDTERRDRRFGRREGPSRICRRARPRNHDRLARRSGRGPAARGKRVIAFYGEVDFDATTLSSNTSRSSGRSGAAGASPFRRWTALNGPIWKLRGRGFCPARLNSLIGSPQRHGALLTIVSVAVRSTGDAEGFKTIAIILAHAARVGPSAAALILISATGRKLKDSSQQRRILKDRAHFQLVEPSEDIVQTFTSRDLGGCGCKGHVDGPKPARACR